MINCLNSYTFQLKLYNIFLIIVILSLLTKRLLCYELYHKEDTYRKKFENKKPKTGERCKKLNF